MPGYAHGPLCGAGLSNALLVTEAAALLWLVFTGIASPDVAVTATVAVVGCLAVGVLVPDMHTRATVIGLLVAGGAMAWIALRAPAPGLAPAVVLTFLIATGMILAGRRRPGVEGVEAELAARVDDLARTKDQLLAVVSHEFRTPVTGVMGFARTMSNHFSSLDRETMQLFVQSIEDHSTRLARMVDNLVMAADVVTVDASASCDLHSIITSVASTFECPEHDVHVSLRGDRWAQIDCEAARRVVANLVDNAVKFADDGTLVRVDARPVGTDILVDVTNLGPPLPADLRQRLYQPFEQADSSDSRRVDGLGLGLHIVRQLVEGHGGRVELVESGGLVTFRVRLRAAAATAVAAPLRSETPESPWPPDPVAPASHSAPRN